MPPIITTEYHHQEHREWMSELDFYADEIKIFKKEMERVLLEYSDFYSIIEHVDEYRKILNRKSTQIDNYRRQIILHERHFRDKELGGGEDVWDHIELREKIGKFMEDFEEMKKSLRRFVSKHLGEH